MLLLLRIREYIGNPRDWVVRVLVLVTKLLRLDACKKFDPTIFDAERVFASILGTASVATVTRDVLASRL